MKVAIYGDSFGSEKPIFQKFHENQKFISPSWVSLLRADYDIDNFCESGSDHYFSFKNFLENYQKYSLNIFIETSPQRLSTPLGNGFLHNHNENSAIWKLKDELDLDKVNICQAAVSYFRYLQSDKKDQIISNLFRDKIKNLDTNCILIDAFGDNGLYNITAMENDYWNYTPKYTKNDKVCDLRYSHMTRENNVILYTKIKDCIENNNQFEFQIKDFQQPKIKDKDLYFVEYKKN